MIINLSNNWFLLKKNGFKSIRKDLGTQKLQKVKLANKTLGEHKAGYSKNSANSNLGFLDDAEHFDRAACTDK
jgi:hypothetical protein